MLPVPPGTFVLLPPQTPPAPPALPPPPSESNDALAMVMAAVGSLVLLLAGLLLMRACVFYKQASAEARAPPEFTATRELEMTTGKPMKTYKHMKNPVTV